MTVLRLLFIPVVWMGLFYLSYGLATILFDHWFPAGLCALVYVVIFAAVAADEYRKVLTKRLEANANTILDNQDATRH